MGNMARGHRSPRKVEALNFQPRLNARTAFVRSAYLLAAGLLAGAAPLAGEVGTNNSVSVTSTAQTIAVGATNDPAADVLVVNDSTSSNEIYFRLFVCGETVSAATTSSVRLQPGESRSYRFSTSESGNGYCNVSLVCASAETATARVEWK
jgi:hypothetical protein